MVLRNKLLRKILNIQPRLGYFHILRFCPNYHSTWKFRSICTQKPDVQKLAMSHDSKISNSHLLAALLKVEPLRASIFEGALLEGVLGLSLQRRKRARYLPEIHNTVKSAPNSKSVWYTCKYPLGHSVNIQYWSDRYFAVSVSRHILNSRNSDRRNYGTIIGIGYTRPLSTYLLLRRPQKWRRSLYPETMIL